jgi:hypothetical protein
MVAAHVSALPRKNAMKALASYMAPVQYGQSRQVLVGACNPLQLLFNCSVGMWHKFDQQARMPPDGRHAGSVALELTVPMLPIVVSFLELWFCHR